MDRETIVSRHRPSLTSINTSEVAVLGNGAFALSIDVTGLQTLNRTFSGVPNASSPYRCRCPAHADVFFPLMTGSDWGWHSFKPPGPPGSRADPFAPPQANSFWDRWEVSSNRSTPPRLSWYPTGSAATPLLPHDPELRAAMEWRGQNPHRLSLGQIALRKLEPRKDSNGRDGGGGTVAIEAEEISNINQTLDLWAGVAHSRFTLSGTPAPGLAFLTLSRHRHRCRCQLPPLPSIYKWPVIICKGACILFPQGCASNARVTTGHDAHNTRNEVAAGPKRSPHNMPLEPRPVSVDSCVHGEADLVSASIDSSMVADGTLGVAVSFGGGSGAKNGANWTSGGEHTSEIVQAASSATSVLILRTFDAGSQKQLLLRRFLSCSCSVRLGFDRVLKCSVCPRTPVFLISESEHDLT